MNMYVSFAVAHWPLFGLLTIIILLMLAYELPHRLKGIQRLTPQQTINLMNHQHARIIDIRDTPQFHTGHILGAETTSTDDSSATKIAKKSATPVVVIAAKEPEAVKYASKLRKAGCESVYVLRGGMGEWLQAGLPIHKPV